MTKLRSQIGGYARGPASTAGPDFRCPHSCQTALIAASINVEATLKIATVSAGIPVTSLEPEPYMTPEGEGGNSVCSLHLSAPGATPRKDH